MKIALYLVAALAAVIALFYLYSLIGGALMVLWQVLLVLAAVAVTALIVRGVQGARRGRRAPSRLIATKPLAVDAPIAKADVKAEKKAERSAEKELRTLEASLGTKNTPPATRAATDEPQVLRSKRQ